MRKIWLGVAALALTTLTLAGDRPNVLFIAIDDLNDWIGCLGGHPQALTPNIDEIASRGVLFTNAHCAAPACKPSRAAVFSGRMPHRTEVWSNKSGSIEKLATDAVQIPAVFNDAGYRTRGTGKLSHSSKQRDFQEYFSVEQRWSPLPGKKVKYTDESLPTKGTDNPRHVVEHGGETYVLPLNRMPSDRRPDTKDGESHDWGAWEVPDSEFGDTQITDWAIQRIGEDSDQPFFIGVGYYRPHIPLWAPARFFERFEEEPGKLPPVLENDLDDLSEVGRRWALEPITSGSHETTVRFGQWQPAVEAYLACVTYVDHELGRLLAALEDSGHSDNTIIVLWSDHGWHLGEKEHWGKWTGWERSTRVPMMIAPARTRPDLYANAGTRCDQPVGLIDLYPTLTDLCGLEAPEGLDGESLMPLLKDPGRETGRHLFTLFDPGNVSVRDTRWRYIQYADQSEELYDLKKDPNEWENLVHSPEHTAILEQFKASVGGYFAE